MFVQNRHCVFDTSFLAIQSIKNPVVKSILSEDNMFFFFTSDTLWYSFLVSILIVSLGWYNHQHPSWGVSIFPGHCFCAIKITRDQAKWFIHIVGNDFEFATSKIVQQTPGSS